MINKKKLKYYAPKVNGEIEYLSENKKEKEEFKKIKNFMIYIIKKKKF